MNPADCSVPTPRHLVRGIHEVPADIETAALVRAVYALGPAIRAVQREIEAGANGLQLRRLRKIEKALVWSKQHITGGFGVDERGKLI